MQVLAADLPDQCLEWVAKGDDMVGTLWGNSLGSPEDRTHTPICDLFCRGTPVYMHSWTCSSPHSGRLWSVCYWRWPQILPPMTQGRHM
jgi:hypothetical protein